MHRWKKILIVNRETGQATFRSITEDASYKPKKRLRRDAAWWLDNSIMDANMQQMRAFRLEMQNYYVQGEQFRQISS